MGTEQDNVVENAPAGGTDDALAARAAEAEKNAAELKDRLLRNAAEFENYKKRVRREVEEAQHAGRERLLTELLSVMDNLTLALTHAAEDDPVARGVRMVEKQMLGVLEKFDVRRFSALGQPFDPARHQAVQQVEDPARTSGTVVSEFATGYLHGDRLFRAAMVAVSTGGPDPAPSAGGERPPE